MYSGTFEGCKDLGACFNLHFLKRSMSDQGGQVKSVGCDLHRQERFTIIPAGNFALELVPGTAIE